MATDAERDADLGRLKKTVEALSEHFDSVMIFASRHEGDRDTTVSFQWGGGNFHARRGQIRSWLIKKDEEDRIDARKDDQDT